MKHQQIILTVVCLSMACNSFSQSSFALRNYYPPIVNAPVFDAQGIPLAGPNYLAELWGGATPDELTPLVVLDQGHRREIVTFIRDGYFVSGSGYLSVLDVLPGDSAWVQVRAWDCRLGATYEDVLASGLGGYGQSPLLFAKGGNPVSPTPTLPGLLIGLQSFSLLPEVPEPSTWAVFVFGGVSLVWAMRRQRLYREA